MVRKICYLDNDATHNIPQSYQIETVAGIIFAPLVKITDMLL
jgi:hypothetical protein